MSLRPTLVKLALGLLFSVTAPLSGAAVYAQLCPACGHAAPMSVKDLRHRVVLYGAVVNEASPIWRSTVRISNANHLCSGVIIAHDTILTAGHCLEDETTVTVDFFSGTGQVLKSIVSSSRLTHEMYKIIRHDIGIIHLSADIPPGYIPVDLEDDRKMPTVGSDVMFAGFGRREDGAEGDLRFAAGKIAEHWSQGFLLDVRFGKYDMWGEEKHDERDSTQAYIGNSGGPGFIETGGELKVWGLVNSGSGSTDSGNGTTFTKVSMYLNWIHWAVAQLRLQGNGSGSKSGSSVSRLSYRVLKQLNMHSGPGTAFSLVTAIPDGSSGITAERCREAEPEEWAFKWCEAEWENKKGWISSCCLVED